MAIRKITFDGSQVTSKDDADVYHHLFGLAPAGIIQGLYAEVALSAGNNQITLGKGVVAVYGRIVLIESNTQIAINLDSQKYGYVVLQVDLASNAVLITKLETSNNYPTLTQNNLHATNGLYQFPLARYTKTATSLTLDTSYQRPFIKTAPTHISELRTEMRSYVEANYGALTLTPYSSVGDQVTKYSLGSLDLEKCLFTVRLMCGVTLTFPGRLISSRSLTNVSYQYLMTNYYFVVEYTMGNVFLYSSSTSPLHRVAQTQVWR